MTKHNSNFKFSITRTAHQTSSVKVDGKNRLDAYYNLLKKAKNNKWLNNLNWSQPISNKKGELVFDVAEQVPSNDYFYLKESNSLTQPELRHVTKKRKNFTHVIWKLQELKRLLPFTNWLEDSYGVGLKPPHKRYHGSLDEHINNLNDNITLLKDHTFNYINDELSFDEISNLDDEFPNIQCSLEDALCLAAEALMSLSAIESIRDYRPEEFIELSKLDEVA